MRGEMGKNAMMPGPGSPMRDRLSGHTIPGQPRDGSMYRRGEEEPGGPPPHAGEIPNDRYNSPKDYCDTCSGNSFFRRPGEYGKRVPYGGHFAYHRPFDVISFFIFLMIIALSSAMRIMQQWQMTEQRATQAEADKVSAELSFLKAQINPHFLFNTLNNIYTLAVMKDDNAPDSILKLSNIMRYVTNDATQDFVPLVHEIDCINDYIELQRLRLGEKTQLELEISGAIEDKKIPPLILMTFIENVFKYGVSKHHQSAIVIKLKGDDTGISFFCQNRIFPEKEEKRREGIGLRNTQKRLAHLYPGKYILDINTDNHLYTVKLILHTA